MLCHVEHENWQVVGFEYVPGRPADLSPGSADLGRVRRVLDVLSDRPAGDTRPLRLRWSNPDYWRNAAERAPESVRGWDIDEMCHWSARVPELVDGDRLVHTDLHRDQFLITEDGRVFVIDWAFPAAGAPWVDSAFLSLRLTAAGRAPAEAVRWAALDRDAMVEAVTAWSVYVAGLWSWFATQDSPLPGADRRARLARDYAAWCLRELVAADRSPFRPTAG